MLRALLAPLAAAMVFASSSAGAFAEEPKEPLRYDPDRNAPERVLPPGPTTPLLITVIERGSTANASAAVKLLADRAGRSGRP